MTDMPKPFTSRKEYPEHEEHHDRGEYSTDRREPSMRRKEHEEHSWLEGSYKAIAVTVLTFLFSILILSFVGKFLWNVSVVQMFTIARPVESVWQIIALMLLLSLLR